MRVQGRRRIEETYQGAQLEFKVGVGGGDGQGVPGVDGRSRRRR